MTEFRYMHGFVYILENILAQRTKIGMTINPVQSRLEAINDMWLEKKATCQICGNRRLVTPRGLIPPHVTSGMNCRGGNTLPLENDISLAESYLEEIKISVSDARIRNNLKRRIEKFRDHKPPKGEWEFRIAFYTECAEQVELLTHKMLENYLDKDAPFGEVFCCTVSKATESVESVLNQLGLFQSAKKEFKLRKFNGTSFEPGA